MKIYNSPLSVWFDWDETLCAWKSPEKINPESHIQVLVFTGISHYNFILYKKVVDQLIRHKERGHFVVIHTQTNVDTVENIVKAVGLDKYIDVIINKPSWIYDDSPPNTWYRANILDKMEGYRE